MGSVNRDDHDAIVEELEGEIATLRRELELAREWIQDLQSGMYINCVYCGHRYGPDDEVPASMADVLKEHVSQCPKHPMSTLRARYEALRGAAEPIVRHGRFGQGTNEEWEALRTALADGEEEG
jgi:hypothetical protein